MPGFLESLKQDAEGSEGGAQYVTGDEKDEIVVKSIPFTISAVEERANPFDSEGQQYVFTVELAGEERLMTFNKGVGSRDRSVTALLESGELGAGPVGPITLRKEKTAQGRSVTLFATI